MDYLIFLQTSLLRVVINYCDSQKTNTKLVPNSQDLTHRIYEFLKLPTEEFNAFFTNYIQKHLENYRDRIPLMSFMLNEIVYLKTIHARQIPLNEDELGSLIKNISNFIIDLRQLITTPKNTGYQTHSQELIKGCFDGGYLRTYCTTGKLLIQLFEKFDLTVKSDDEHIKDIVLFHCTTFQKDLCLRYGKEKKLAQLGDQLSAISLENQQLTKELNTLQRKEGELNAEIEALKLKNSEYKDTRTQETLNRISSGYYGSLFGVRQNAPVPTDFRSISPTLGDSVD